MENKAVRRANLLHLIEQYGSIKAVADLTETAAAHLSQIKNGVREMGDEVARRIEVKQKLPVGAMDSDLKQIDDRLAPDERELLQKYRQASPRWRVALRYMAALHGELQDEVAESMNVVLAKITADAVPDSRLGSDWTRPDRRPT